MDYFANLYLLFLLLPTASLGLTISGKEAPMETNGFHIVWLTSTVIQLYMPDNSRDIIHLVPSVRNANITIPCVFSGKLEQDHWSVVAVAGCKDSKETSISIASGNVPGGLVDLSVVDGVTNTVDDEISTQTTRHKRAGDLVISKNDFLIPPPAFTRATIPKPSACSPLPDGVVLETSIRYDDSLLTKFGGSHSATKNWISSVVELARPRLSLASLQVKVQIQVVGEMEHHNGVVKALDTTILGLQSTLRPKSLVSFFSADIGWGVVGIAFRGSACRKDGYAININEYYTETNPKINTARTFVHELGHNMGMRHDFDEKHGGEDGVCNGKGLMSYGDKPDAWSTCSNDDFASWYRDQGFTCLLTDSGVNADEDCGMVIYGGSYGSTNSNYGPSKLNPYHVITNENDYFWYDPVGAEKMGNYWLVDSYKKGTDAQLYMNFACTRTIIGFKLKNTHNAEAHNSGTENFSIRIWDSRISKWTTVLTGTLPDARQVSHVPVKDFKLGRPVSTQKVIFQIDSYYGVAGGLQYLSAY